MTIDVLANHPEFRSTLAEWYLREWPGLFSEGSPFDEMDSASNPHGLDCTLVGIVDGRVAASAAILTEDVLPLPEYSPWMGTVVVAPELRGRGHGREIVRAAMAHAARCGVASLHLWTPGHRAFYEKLGWRFVQEYLLHGHNVSILRICFP